MQGKKTSISFQSHIIVAKETKGSALLTLQHVDTILCNSEAYKTEKPVNHHIGDTAYYCSLQKLKIKMFFMFDK